MKILVLNWQDWLNPQSGGAEIHLYEIFRRIAAQGHDVTLFCCRSEDRPDEETVSGIRIIRRGSRSLFNYLVPWYYLFRFRRDGFDVVVDDVNKIPFYTPLYVRKPLVAISHHFFGTSIFRETWLLPALYVYLSEWLVNLIYKRTRFLVVSNSTLDEFVRRGFDRSSFTLVFNALDHARIHPTGVPKTAHPTVGYFGRLKKYKSVDHVLKAFATVKAKVPEAELVVIGRGTYRDELERLADRLGIASSVRFTGFVSEEEKQRLLQELWVVVNPSMKEGWGIVNVEANACGTPAIAADSPGLRDSVIHEETGELYPYGDVDNLAERLVRLIEDKDRRERYRRHALDFAKSFSWDDSAAETLRVLQDEIRAKGD
jgi:glycosyltransferase involved in cell wall biosynthesis